MKKRHILGMLFFSVISVVIVGFLGLKIDTARSKTIFGVLVLTYVAGIFFRRYFTDYRTYTVYLLSGAGFIFYFVSGLLLKIPFAPPTLCLFLYTLAFYSPFRNHLLLVVLVLFLSVYYSWFWYPNKLLIKETYLGYKTTELESISYLSSDSLSLINRNGENVANTQFPGKVILIETWNERCGACIHAMKELHPLLEDMERKNKQFKHYYLYTAKRGLALDPISVFSHSLIPYPDMPILYDVNQVFYQVLPQDGFPHFIVFNQKGTSIAQFQGYNHNFNHLYERFFKRVIHEASHSENSN